MILVILGVAGTFSDGTLFLFTANGMHNAFRIFSGLALLDTARSHHLSQWGLMVWGSMFAIVPLAGFLWDGNIFGYFSTNRADDFLYAIIALTALIVSFSGNIPVNVKKKR